MPEFQLQGRDDPRLAKLDAFTIAYIEAAFFTAPEDLGDPDTLAVQQLSNSTLSHFVFNCAQFQRRAGLPMVPEDACCRGTGSCSLHEQAGHDFWMSHNGHGCGFWDGDWAEPYGSRLDAFARIFPQINLYRGDDGRIYA